MNIYIEYMILATNKNRILTFQIKKNSVHPSCSYNAVFTLARAHCTKKILYIYMLTLLPFEIPEEIILHPQLSKMLTTCLQYRYTRY